MVGTYIKNFRKKLNIDYIKAIWGIGYKIEKEDKKQPVYYVACLLMVVCYGNPEYVEKVTRVVLKDTD